MSIWTHVAAMFRIDGIRDSENEKTRINFTSRPDWDKVIGRVIHEHDVFMGDSYSDRRTKDDWVAYDEHPELFVPTGSEGSLQKLVWVNPDRSCAAAYTVTVFGDLRDYSNQKAIKEWFEGVCAKCYIRQAVCDCEVEGVGHWAWGCSWDTFGDGVVDG